MDFKHPAITNYGMYMACKYMYLPAREIAEITGQNRRTVRGYFEVLARRLGVSNRTTMMRILLATGFEFNLTLLESKDNAA